MRLDFLAEGPAVLVENAERTLVAADLHLGIESDLAVHGWHFASRSDERVSRLGDLVDRLSPDRLLLLGDVKHAVPFTTRQEWRELPGALAALRSRVPLLVVPGNHDPGIERFLSPGELAEKNGTVVDGVGYLHGHTIPGPALAGRLVLIGHHHPLAAIRDEVGCALRSPACLSAVLDGSCLGLPPADTPTRALLVPAFNELAGYDVRRIVADPFSPVSRCLVPESVEVLLADGTLIGPIESLGPMEDWDP
ncbi:MAG: metallophosphoesterase [Methanospirillum sp.]|nr:metallophosphoesterase [Methanospirillum sp.]